ncbi:hypothetical protein M501DRAFT_927837 [Patellaria atrata CBS 101060]|uniref:Ribosomal protein S15 n=1 Tax=Patellaria atrata CBS 101060 TaxID=1346257 RepID=A0A9P4VQG5_9PEZI|nr:hypothetical protein M501DRAFT_927837 [Patellaria atrata CBS 101060]
MPPRIPLFSCLRTANISSPPLTTTSFSRTFTTTSPHQKTSTATQRRRKQDPYALAQARARKAANISRRTVLEAERTAALGDPIRGLTTPFLESFDAGLPPPPKTSSTTVSASSDISPPAPTAPQESHLNYLLKPSTVTSSLAHSAKLASPLPDSPQTPYGSTYAELQAQHSTGHATATAAIQRIVSLANGSQKDRTHANIQRCISVFGRHETDKTLPPKPSVQLPPKKSGEPHVPSNGGEIRQRAGPDTGSSEVQIAILTARIRVLDQFLQTRGKMDKHNKRNLRLLVHRRQKLLQYLRRKERGGPRWQHLVETLGLTDGMWKGEITL